MSSPLLINEPPLQVLPTLARMIGLNEAIVLQQVHYWLNPQFNKNFFKGCYWVRNTYERWQQQFPFRSERTLRRTMKNLEAGGLLVSCMGGQLKQIKFYTINYDLLNRIDFANPKSSFLGKADESFEEEEHDSIIQESAENKGFCPSGQNGPVIWPEWPGQQGENGDETPPEASETKVFYPTWPKRPAHPAKMATSSGQSGRVIWPKWPSSPDKMTTPPGQNGHLSYRENTVREYSKITPLPPPLTPPQKFSLSKKENEEEEEEKKIKFEFENTTPHSKHSGSGHPADEHPGSEHPEGGFSKSEHSASEHSRSEHPQSKHPVGEHPVSEYPAGDEPMGESEETETPSENKLLSEMIAIWNQTVQVNLTPGQDVRLTPKRESFLVRFLNAVFIDKTPLEKLEAWKGYCALIARSRFLAGKNASGFKVSLDWALVPEKAYKILEGAIYDQPEPVPQGQQSDQFFNQSWEAFAQELAKALPPSPYREEWLRVSQHLAKTLGQTRYKSWFSKVSLGEVSDVTATLHVEDPFIKTYIDNHFRFEILRAIKTVYPQVMYVHFSLVPCAGGAS